MDLNLSTLALPKFPLLRSFFGSGHKVSSFLGLSGNTPLQYHALYYPGIDTCPLLAYVCVFVNFVLFLPED